MGDHLVQHHGVGVDVHLRVDGLLARVLQNLRSHKPRSASLSLVVAQAALSANPKIRDFDQYFIRVVILELLGSERRGIGGGRGQFGGPRGGPLQAVLSRRKFEHKDIVGLHVKVCRVAGMEVG